jgi:hypothetical protein
MMYAEATQSSRLCSVSDLHALSGTWSLHCFGLYQVDDEASSCTNHCLAEACYTVTAGLSRMAPDYSSSVGTVVAAEEQLTEAALKAAPTRSTKLLQLDISKTHLLYDPGAPCLLQA